MQGVTKHSEKADILTPWKEQDRYKREVYVSPGTPDPATRKGNFYRVANIRRPELNSREGVAPARKRGRSTLSSFVEENGLDE